MIPYTFLIHIVLALFEDIFSEHHVKKTSTISYLNHFEEMIQIYPFNINYVLIKKSLIKCGPKIWQSTDELACICNFLFLFSFFRKVDDCN